MAKFSRGDLREILKDAGATDENIETAVTKIVRLHLDVVDPLKSENDTISKKDKEVEKLKSQLETVETELAELKKADYKKQLDDVTAERDKLKADFEAYKTEQAGKEARAAKEAAYTEILKDAGIPEKHFAKILKYSDVDGIELDEKGKAKNAKDILKAVKDEWGDHVETTVTKGTDTPKPPAGNGSNPVKTKDEIMKITDAGERQAAIAEALKAGSPEFK